MTAAIVVKFCTHVGRQ